MDSDSRIVHQTRTFDESMLKQIKKAQKRAHKEKVDPELHLFWKDDLDRYYDKNPFLDKDGFSASVSNQNKLANLCSSIYASVFSIIF